VSSSVRAKLDKAVGTKHRCEQIRINREFYKWCGKNGFSTVHPTLLSMAGYICQFVSNLASSTKSISNIVGAIKYRCEVERIPYLDRADQLVLSDLVKDLKLGDLIAVSRVCPLTRKILGAVSARGRERDVRFLQVITMLTVAHDGLLRSAEICSDMKPRSLTWNLTRMRVAIHLWRTKCHRAGNGQSITLVDYGRRSGCALLRRWMRKMGMSDYSNCYLFPRFDDRSKKFDWSKGTTTDRYRKYIKGAVKSVGLNPVDYSGHSPRAGGATDLLNNEVPVATVQKFGRWRTNCVLVYYRDEERIANRVGAAFGQAAHSPKYASQRNTVHYHRR